MSRQPARSSHATGLHNGPSHDRFNLEPARCLTKASRPLRSFGFVPTNGCNELINGRSPEFWPIDRLTLEAPKSTRMSWARLLKRVFDIDIEWCACSGQIIVAIEAPAVIARILISTCSRVRHRVHRARAAHTRGLIRKHNNGSAAEPTNSLGPQLCTALNLRRDDAIRDGVGFKSSRQRNFHRVSCR